MISRAQLSRLLNERFPHASFQAIGADVDNRGRQRFVINYSGVDIKDLYPYLVEVLPADAIFYTFPVE